MAAQTVMMEELLDRRSSDATKDLEPETPNWAQPHHQTRTKALLNAAMAASCWNNQKLTAPSFGALVVILLPDNCCDQTHSLRLSVGKFLPSPIQPVVPIPSMAIGQDWQGTHTHPEAGAPTQCNDTWAGSAKVSTTPDSLRPCRPAAAQIQST